MDATNNSSNDNNRNDNNSKNNNKENNNNDSKEGPMRTGANRSATDVMTIVLQRAGLPQEIVHRLRVNRELRALIDRRFPTIFTSTHEITAPQELNIPLSLFTKVIQEEGHSKFWVSLPFYDPRSRRFVHVYRRDLTRPPDNASACWEIVWYSPEDGLAESRISLQSAVRDLLHVELRAEFSAVADNGSALTGGDNCESLWISVNPPAAQLMDQQFIACDSQRVLQWRETPAEHSISLLRYMASALRCVSCSQFMCTQHRYAFPIADYNVSLRPIHCWRSIVVFSTEEWTQTEGDDFSFACGPLMIYLLRSTHEPLLLRYRLANRHLQLVPKQYGMHHQSACLQWLALLDRETHRFSYLNLSDEAHAQPHLIAGPRVARADGTCNLIVSSVSSLGCHLFVVDNGPMNNSIINVVNMRTGAIVRQWALPLSLRVHVPDLRTLRYAPFGLHVDQNRLIIYDDSERAVDPNAADAFGRIYICEGMNLLQLL